MERRNITIEDLYKMTTFEYTQWIAKSKKRDLKRILSIKLPTFKKRNELIVELTNKITFERELKK